MIHYGISYVLIYYMKYFFGCQFETLRPEDILVAKIKTT